MTAVLFFAGLAVGGVGGSLGSHRYTIRRVRRADVAHYQNAWDPGDREALLEEVAVQTVRAADDRRGRAYAERVARQVTGLLIRLRPDNADPGYPLDYGAHRG